MYHLIKNDVKLNYFLHSFQVSSLETSLCFYNFWRTNQVLKLYWNTNHTRISFIWLVVFMLFLKLTNQMFESWVHAQRKYIILTPHFIQLVMNLLLQTLDVITRFGCRQTRLHSTAAGVQTTMRSRRIDGTFYPAILEGLMCLEITLPCCGSTTWMKESTESDLLLVIRWDRRTLTKHASL